MRPENYHGLTPITYCDCFADILRLIKLFPKHPERPCNELKHPRRWMVAPPPLDRHMDLKHSSLCMVHLPSQARLFLLYFPPPHTRLPQAAVADPEQARVAVALLGPLVYLHGRIFQSELRRSKWRCPGHTETGSVWMGESQTDTPLPFPALCLCRALVEL